MENECGFFFSIRLVFSTASVNDFDNLRICCADLDVWNVSMPGTPWRDLNLRDVLRFILVLDFNDFRSRLFIFGISQECLVTLLLKHTIDLLYAFPHQHFPRVADGCDADVAGAREELGRSLFAQRLRQLLELARAGSAGEMTAVGFAHRRHLPRKCSAVEPAYT